MVDTPRTDGYTLLAYLVAKPTPQAVSLSNAVRNDLRALTQAAHAAGIPVAAQVFYSNKRSGVRMIIRPEQMFEPGDLERPFSFVTPPGTQHDFDPSEVCANSRWGVAPGGPPNDEQALRIFVDWAKSESPTTKYAAFFFGHGYGPMGLFYSRPREEPGMDLLRLDELASALDGQPLDLLMLKSCHLGILETAYQLNSRVHVLVATQESPALAMWPWPDLISALHANGDSEASSRKIVATLGEFFKNPDNRDNKVKNIPYSAVRTSTSRSFEEPIRGLVKAIRDDPSMASRVRHALNDSRHKHPGEPVLVDIGRLGDRLQAESAKHLREIGQQLRRALDSTLIELRTLEDSYTGLSLYFGRSDRATATAVTIDTDPDIARYRRLALSKDTDWDTIAVPTPEGVAPT